MKLFLIWSLEEVLNESLHIIFQIIQDLLVKPEPVI